MTIYRMDHAAVVVEELAADIVLFVGLGLAQEGGSVKITGSWSANVLT
jgi:hypothetical protein